MTRRILFASCLILAFSLTVSARNDAMVELLKHIDRLDMKLAAMEQKHETEIAALKKDNALREAVLMRKIDELTERVASLEEPNDDLRKTSEDNGPVENVDLNGVRESNKIIARKIRPRPFVLADENGANPRRAISADYNIAFTAYMDHDADHLGRGQTLHFNQILLNDGNGYNKHSGVFTAPVTGVYSFTFFIGQRGNNDAGAALMVNDVNKVDARVQTDGTYEDAQGGNSAVLKVAAGDIVFVKNMFGVHLEAHDEAHRYTTFSGFLLYPVDGGPVIVGK